jgi:hypothetical protein
MALFELSPAYYELLFYLQPEGSGNSKSTEKII